MTFNEDATSYALNWWFENILSLIRKNATVTINTDASSYGRGVSFEGNNTEVNAHWRSVSYTSMY